EFKNRFERFNREAGKKQFLTYYLIAAHPGCTMDHMLKLRQFVSRQLKVRPEQVQIFTPTPSTYSSLMYWTETNPFTKKTLFVEKNSRAKEKQKMILLPKPKQKTH
ncbi:MAG: DUF3362 domain-containing protein, partial [Xanthomonadaceae bacterium]|nr:DUF3362 domain-containing protein [Xanthomonadaceae bacterium]